MTHFQEQGCFHIPEESMKIKLITPVLPPSLKGRIVKPSTSILDKSFAYTSAVHTDLAKTFARARVKLGIEV